MTDPRFVRPAWRGRTNVDALTIAALEAAEAKAGHQFVVTQGSYQHTVAASGTTHDGGGVIDLRWCGHNACIGHLRRAGFAAWHRTPAQGFTHHIHAVVVGHPLLSASAARQVESLRAGRNGLASNGRDDGPRLPVVPPVWPWPPEPKPNKVKQARRLAHKAAKILATVPKSRKAAHGMKRNIRAALRKGPKA